MSPPQLVHNFEQWARGASLAELETLVGLIAKELVARGMPGTLDLFKAQTTMQRVRLGLVNGRHT